MSRSTSSSVSRWRRDLALCLALVITSALLAACGSSGSSGGASGGGQTLTIWSSGAPAQNGQGFIYPVIKDFEAAHPGVKVQIVAEPPGNYFAVLKNAMIGYTGPDIAQVYAGTYSSDLIPVFLNLNAYVPASTRDSLAGVQYYAENSNPSLDTFALPYEEQFYNMWYNKALFAKAGIKAPPTDFSQMATDCRLLTEKGISPLADGNPTFVTPGMGAIQDWSYLAAAPYSLKQWNQILDGGIPYNSPALIAEVNEWANMFKAGCATESILTENANQKFVSGKAAMVMNFNSLYSTYAPSLKSNLGIMIPPWSPTPQHNLIELPGAGYAVVKTSPNAKLAAEFVAFTVSKRAQEYAAADGQLPVISSVPAQGPPSQLIAMANSGKYHLYPMFDNYMPQDVVAQIDNQLTQAFVGSQSASGALGAMLAAYKGLLPASQQHPNFNLGG